MDVAVIDIGNSFTKAYMCQASRKGIEVLKESRKRTARSFDGIFAGVTDLLSEVEADGFYLSGIIFSGFSDAVVLHYVTGKYQLVFALDPGQQQTRFNLPYSRTGYTTLFPNLHERLRTAHLHGKIARALPVSAMVAARLCGNTAWKHWDITHASNSGMWDHISQKWITTEHSDIIDPHIVLPASVVGDYLHIPVMVGGHDTLFCCANTPKAYVTTGTWTIASQPQQAFSPDTDQETAVRWLCDAESRLHKQILFKTPETLEDLVFERVANFMDGCDVEIVVSGAFAKEMADRLKQHFDITLVENLQYTEAAQYAWRHLQ